MRGECQRAHTAPTRVAPFRGTGSLPTDAEIRARVCTRCGDPPHHKECPNCPCRNAAVDYEDLRGFFGPALALGFVTCLWAETLRGLSITSIGALACTLLATAGASISGLWNSYPASSPRKNRRDARGTLLSFGCLTALWCIVLFDRFDPAWLRIAAGLVALVTSALLWTGLGERVRVETTVAREPREIESAEPAKRQSGARASR